MVQYTVRVCVCVLYIATQHQRLFLFFPWFSLSRHLNANNQQITAAHLFRFFSSIFCVPFCLSFEMRQNGKGKTIENYYVGINFSGQKKKEKYFPANSNWHTQYASHTHTYYVYCFMCLCDFADDDVFISFGSCIEWRPSDNLWVWQIVWCAKFLWY